VESVSYCVIWGKRSAVVIVTIREAFPERKV
jgi:hypothetical protein